MFLGKVFALHIRTKEVFTFRTESVSFKRSRFSGVSVFCINERGQKVV